MLHYFRHVIIIVILSFDLSWKDISRMMIEMNDDRNMQTVKHLIIPTTMLRIIKPICRMRIIIVVFTWYLHLLSSSSLVLSLSIHRHRVSSLHRSMIQSRTSIRHHNYDAKIILSVQLYSQSKDDSEIESQRLKAKAEELRQQIQKLEEQLISQRKTIIRREDDSKTKEQQPTQGRSLKNKRILVIGANGRLGSMVVRYLLRNYPEVGEVVAAVHYVGTASTRGYGRLSYEVGAEDGVGTIGPIWNADDRDATFMYSNDMKSYNLQKLRVVPTELLDPTQCKAITQDIDSVIWCATDFNGNIPRSISSLDSALLFRAIVDLTKGRVEIEGLTNILGAFYQSKLNQSRMKRVSEASLTSSTSTSLDSPNDPISFVLISTTPSAFGDFETPYGEFNALKRQGEQIVFKDYPSLTSCILQMSKFEDNFVQESLEIQMDRQDGSTEDSTRMKRRINRRDAAKAAVQALVDDTLVGKVTQIWTAVSK